MHSPAHPDEAVFLGMPAIIASEPMRRLMSLVERVARSAATVLVTGESGSGKELIARAVHEKSPRKSGPFVTLNCAAVPQELIESELFGHEKGAFTEPRRATPASSSRPRAELCSWTRSATCPR